MEWMNLVWLSSVWLGQPAWMWLVFAVSVLSLLAFDLGVLGKKRGGDGTIGVRQSLSLSAFYIAAAAAFGGWVWVTLGAQSGMEYFRASRWKRRWRWITCLSSA